MIPRQIREEEIQSITTLFQCAENIGSGVHTEESIRELITITWENTPPVRAKDVDMSWMIDFMKRMRDHSEELFRLSLKDDAAHTAHVEKKAPTPKALYVVRGKSILDTGDSISWYFTNSGVLNIKQKYLFSKKILADIKKAEASGFDSEDVAAANELFTKKEALALVKEVTNKKIGDGKKLKKVKVSEVTIETVNLPISIPCIPTDLYSHDYAFGNDTGITAYGSDIPTLGKKSATDNTNGDIPF